MLSFKSKHFSFPDSCCLTEESTHTGEVSQLPLYLEKGLPTVRMKINL
jgi:hypothetical protein